MCFLIIVNDMNSSSNSFQVSLCSSVAINNIVKQEAITIHPKSNVYSRYTMLKLVVMKGSKCLGLR